MSILIKGMEMPFDGSFATIMILPDGTVQTRRGDSLPYTAVSVPAADIAPVRHGRWLIKTVRGDKRTVCSECLSETGTCYEENYCPNCGAKMDKEAEE